MEFGKAARPLLLVCAILYATAIFAHKINRRLVDEKCGQPSPDAPEVDKCFHRHDQNDKSCSYPSEPRNLTAEFKFDNKTRIFRINISWVAPRHGVKSLWGYEVHLGGMCYQINIKEKKKYNHFLHPEKFSYADSERRDYRLLISSLPRESSDFMNSVEKIISLPDKCKTYSENGITDSVDCVSITNTTIYRSCVAGVNTSSIIAFRWPNSKSYDGIEFAYSTDEKCPNGRVEGNALVKRGKSVTGFFTIPSMVKDCNYEIWARAFKHEEADDTRRFRKWQKQLTIRCNNHSINLVAPFAANKNVKRKPIIIIVSTTLAVLFLLLVVTIALRKNISTCHGSPIHHNGVWHKGCHAALTIQQPVVMLIWCHGCKAVEDFVLIFASFLHRFGFTIQLDLLENNAIAELGGIANYLIKREESADFVVIVCAGGEDNSFNFILDVIKNKIMMTGSKSRYIPIHFDKNDSQNVPIWLQGVPYRVPDDIEQIIQRMHNIQPYEILSTPLRNSVILDAAKLEELKKAVKFVLLPEHLECNAEHCDKGVSAAVSYVDDSSSVNSFIAVEETIN